MNFSMPKRRWILISAGGLLAALLLFIVINFKHVKSFPGILPAFYAKEFCSCFFVSGQDEKDCHNYARQYLPISAFQLDRVGRSITVSGLFTTRTAVFMGTQAGCRLR